MGNAWLIIGYVHKNISVTSFVHDSLQCTTGIGPQTDSFLAVYRRPAVVDRCLWPTGIAVC